MGGKSLSEATRPRKKVDNLNGMGDAHETTLCRNVLEWTLLIHPDDRK